ncbi:hypothetical protein BDB01DRAFT_792407 [Pilobolus umbonatus]|nr:hypothetical protein BDB01DRAFT_792407 [Pilobolus umbonatus]
MTDTTMNPTKIIFVIDEQLLIKDHTLIDILLEVSRRIVYFYYKIDTNIIWSFRFFDTTKRYTSNTARRFYLISEPFEIIQREYEERQSRYKAEKSINPTHSSICQVLKEAIGDFSWEDCESSIYNETERRHQLFMFTDSIYDIINEDISCFINNMDEMKEVINRSLCAVYANCGVSINLIDNILSNYSDTMNTSATETVRIKYQECLDMFSGRYLQLHELSEDYGLYGYSFRSEYFRLLPVPLSKYTHSILSRDTFTWTGELMTDKLVGLGIYTIIPLTLCAPDLFSKALGIRIRRIMPKTDVPTALLSPLNGKGNYYQMTPSDERYHVLFEPLLHELFNSSCVVLADMPPLSTHTHIDTTLMIEPRTRLSATIIALHRPYDFDELSDRTPLF